ncbi:rhomboid family intramembrane serine protease [Brevundimonas sp.]|uniref:rhomboid family intramembrane serine protease n=1 Tax=Brevundimonas sp. TaxID=1871086 RepID=UPI002D69120F|nr:rhomboid family intramembrane serine protease [Brevundimonas sp.]HYD28234.1 rhomboid family intramembrane serine protease [Brevundimonas sp.]
MLNDGDQPPDLRRRPALTDQPSREPVLKAPLVALLLTASLPILFWLQERSPDGGLSLAFTPASLWRGDWWPGILTSMFLHANWGHVAMNAMGVFAFAPPVARLMPGTRGVVGFLTFYLATGLVSAIGYGLVHPDTFHPLVGASGAVFGLMGAALRLLGRRDGSLRPLVDRRFLVMAAVIMAVNAGAGLIGLAPGAEGARVAWEAHAFGFFAGVLLIDSWLRLFGSRRTSFDSPPDLRDPSA